MEALDILDLATVAPLAAGAPPAAEMPAPGAVIRVRDLVVGFGDKLIMNKLNLDIYRGEVLGFVGGSGTGKSVLARTILGLVQKRSRNIETFGGDSDAMSESHRRAVERR